MSFYEDMGVGPGASVEEIREQYHVLVRLFHPDQFSDPVLKRVAEGQLRRFNEMEWVLTDSTRRRAYDATLLQSNEPPVLIHVPPRERPVPWGSLAWGAAALSCAATIVWVSGHETPAPPVPELHSFVARVEPVSSATQQEDWRNRARVAIVERDQALREIARLKNEPAHPTPAPLIPAITGPVIAATEASALPAPPALLAFDSRNAANRFAGLWVYARRAGTSTKLYAPEFIETQISERDGQVRGHYRSRYRVTDRAISPSVNFEFSGIATGASAQIPFVRDDGARGDVRLRLLSEHEMELTWTASGTVAPSLTSGSAVLTKTQ